MDSSKSRNWYHFRRRCTAFSRKGLPCSVAISCRGVLCLGVALKGKHFCTHFDTSDFRQQSIVHQHLALGVFASLLNLLSTQYAYHNLGLPVVKMLLSPTSSRKLNAHLNSAQTDLVLVALKVWNALSAYGGGMEKLKVYEQFVWSNKARRNFSYLSPFNDDLVSLPFIPHEEKRTNRPESRPIHQTGHSYALHYVPHELCAYIGRTCRQGDVP